MILDPEDNEDGKDDDADEKTNDEKRFPEDYP